MKKNLLPSVLLAGLLTPALYAQSIAPPANTPLTIEGDLNLPAGKSIQANGSSFLTLPQAGGTNVLMGYSAGAAAQTAAQNTLVGHRAGVSATASANTMIGFQAGASTTSGGFNTFIGVQAGLNNTTGSSNLMLGTNAGSSNTTGTANFFVGDNAGGQNTSGGYNVYLGTNSGNGTGVNGSNNVAIGFEAGRGNSAGSTNTYLGFRADAGASGLTNASAFGANARVTASNSLVLGDNANVGIGTTAPANKLQIVGGLANTAGLRLPLTSASTPSSNATKFLTVNANGDVILANFANGARQVADAETIDLLWTRNGQYLQSKGGEAIIIGSGIRKTPADYKLFVEGGILTEKVKVAIKNANDWSDKVFAPTYNLRPLSEVGKFIKEHHHLPGVPSADEVVKEGVDVGRMDAKLLEKIEELTLYMLQMKEQHTQEIKQLKRELAAVKKKAKISRR
ncbi:bZIP transcription factor [Spirosoma taeanense]|uniref:BZIP transcription factor n=1 Tax=Spirosoma taeanense TaxID=2735870 RepID=A0A6M5YDD5_9BACT|nr:bZIP transcription factor [Spirosoma taeanense]QJW90982.1 bZIP transcription factor [Spirosoma taeanense]